MEKIEERVASEIKVEAGGVIDEYQVADPKTGQWRLANPLDVMAFVERGWPVRAFLENGTLWNLVEDEMSIGRMPSPTPPHNVLAIDEAWLARFAAWNLATFGPGLRTAGTVDHIRKECREIEANPTDPKEWVDIILLGINGLVRIGHTPAQIIAEIHGKHEINEARNWPDWRGTDPSKAIEHDRSEGSTDG